MAKDERKEQLEACCDDCREAIAREPKKARLIFEECEEAKVKAYHADDPFSWE